MKSYLKDLLARISEHSKTLDKLTELKEYPWVTITEEGEKVKYIFRNDGSLLLSKRSGVELGTWEYLSRAQALLITSNNGSKLLNHGFLDENVLVLIEDGSDEVLMFANQANLPSLNAKDYLIKLEKRDSRQLIGKSKELDSTVSKRRPQLISDLKVLTYNLGNKGTLKIHTTSGLQSEKGCKATLDGKPAPDGVYSVSAFNSINVKDGKTV